MAEDDDESEAGPEAWIDFLNADGRPLDLALGRRLEAALTENAGGRALVLCADEMRARDLNGGLWTYDPASFLAHGGPGDGEPDEHPVWVAASEAPADIVVSVDDAEPADWEAYAQRFYLFDARDPAARDAGRARWRQWSGEGKPLAYWSFDGGGWRLERRG